MGDEELRDLERRWHAGSPEAGEAYLRARARRGLALLRFDGFYVAGQEEEDVHSWLRFYDDGEVINVTTQFAAASLSARAARIARWFTRDHEAVGHGVYRQAGLELSFPATCSAGTVDYTGWIQPSGVLELSSHSHINGHRTTRTFTFVPLAVTSAEDAP